MTTTFRIPELEQLDSEYAELSKKRRRLQEKSDELHARLRANHDSGRVDAEQRDSRTHTTLTPSIGSHQGGVTVQVIGAGEVSKLARECDEIDAQLRDSAFLLALHGAERRAARAAADAVFGEYGQLVADAVKALASVFEPIAALAKAEEAFSEVRVTPPIHISADRFGLKAFVDFAATAVQLGMIKADMLPSALRTAVASTDPDKRTVWMGSSLNLN